MTTSAEEYQKCDRFLKTCMHKYFAEYIGKHIMNENGPETKPHSVKMRL